eukprot:scaffold41941_cov17-Tisochrysis_lutea.AAC.1
MLLHGLASAGMLLGIPRKIAIATMGETHALLVVQVPGGCTAHADCNSSTTRASAEHTNPRSLEYNAGPAFALDDVDASHGGKVQEVQIPPQTSFYLLYSYVAGKAWGCVGVAPMQKH